MSGPLGLFVWLSLLFFMAPGSASWAASLRADSPFPHLQHAPPRGFERVYHPSRDVVVLVGQGSHEKQRHIGGDLGLAPAAQASDVRIGATGAFAPRSAAPTHPIRVQAYQARAPPGPSRRADRRLTQPI
jgi:hypothetical protein